MKVSGPKTSLKYNDDPYYPSLAKGNIPPWEKGGKGGFQEQVLPYDKKFKKLSQYLRKNMTDAENSLWLKLRRKQLRGYQFYRQKIIGKYIVDFYCPKANLVIELDGAHHYSETVKPKDRVRDEILREKGLKVLRFSDREALRTWVR